MNTILKRVISLVLCFVLVVGYVPASAIATETGETVTTETTAVTTEATGEPSEETEALSDSTEAPAAQSVEADGSDEEEKSEKDSKKEQKEAEKESKKEEKKSEKESKKEEKPGKPGKPGKPEEATEPSTEATEPSTEATEPSAEATEPFTEANEPSTEATEPSTEPTSENLLMTLEIEDEADPVAAALEVRAGVEVSSTALEKAQAYIDALTINNTSNDPATVVGNFGTHFTWDNEKRESSKSYLFDWSYYNGVVFEGLEYLYEVTGKTVYKDYVEEYMSSMITANGTWASCTNNTSKQAAGYNSTHGADCYKTASLLMDLYEMTNDSRYLTVAATLYADLDAAASKYSLPNAGNNYRHTWASDPSPDLWLDGLYMILPFRAEYAAHIGDTEELDLIVDRMQWVSDKMYNEAKGLFYHAADSATSNSGTYWLRSIGWYAAAIVDIMDSMTGDNLRAMQTQLKKLVDGMLLVQNSANGMWLNNMAAAQSSSNPYETSGTALVCYAVLKAVNEGWLDDDYADMAVLAFNGICSEKLSGTTLKDICFKGAPGDSNSTFYNNEGKGVGPFIMLYAEVLEYTGVKHEQPEQPTEPSEPTEPEVVTKEDTATGVAVTAPGITGLTVSKIEETAQVEQIQQKVAQVLKTENLVMLDIAVVDFTTGSTATVVVPIPEGMDSTKFAVYYVPEEGELELMPGEPVDETHYKFTTTHFSTYVGGERAITSGESSDSGVLETVTGVIEPQENVTEITSGAYYQVWNTRAGQYLSGTVNNNRQNSWSDYTDKVDLVVEGSHYWYITIVDNSYYLQYGGPNGRYLTIGNGSANLTTTPTALSLTWSNNHWLIKGEEYLNDFDCNGDHHAAGYEELPDNGSYWYLHRVASKTYALDTNGMDPGVNNKYVIVGDTEAKALTLSGTTVGNADVILSNNGSNATVIGDVSDYEFYFADNGNRENNTYLLTRDGTNTVRHNGGALSYTTSNEGYWYVVQQNNGQYKVYDFDNSNWHLNYGYSFNDSVTRFSVSNREETVRLYRPITASGGTVNFTVTPASATIQPNGTVALTGTVTVDDKTVDLSDCTITWASSDTSKATVSNGTVTGVADGTANITATLSAVNGTALQEDIVLTIPVTVKAKEVVSVTLSDEAGSVRYNAGKSAKTGDFIIVLYKDGTKDLIPITLAMLDTDIDTKTPDTHSVKVLYTVQGTNYVLEPYRVTVNAQSSSTNDKPEFPDPGAVKLSKVIGNSSQFQDTGVAEVQLSTTGIPIKTGVNTILIMDISNSMSWNDSTYSYTDVAVTPGSTQRLNIAKNSAKEFVTTLLADYEDGTRTENTITLLAFAGIDGKYNTHNTAAANDDVYQVGALAMQDVTTASNAIDSLVKATTGGTNYDYAFQQAYDLAGRLYAENGLDVHIVFMTDGVPTHYNGVYYKSRDNTDLTANMRYQAPGVTYDNLNELPTYVSTGFDSLDEETRVDIDDTDTKSITVYYNDKTTATKTVTYNKGWSDYVTKNKNEWAEEVKSLTYVAKVHSIGFGMKNGSVTQDATKAMPTLNNVNGGTYYIPSDVTKTTLQHVASTADDYYEADNEEDLKKLYASLASKIKQAATNAYFVDEMGDSFRLQRGNSVSKLNGTRVVALNPVPAITVSKYKVYKTSDIGSVIDGVAVTQEMVGKRYGSANVAETIVFNNAGTAAYSSLDGYSEKDAGTDSDGNDIVDYEGTKNILESDKVIYAKNFWYNTSEKAVMIDTDNDGTKDYSLPSETFRWKVGTIDETEYVLSYYVYLEGSAEGQAAAGTYATNNKATLTYLNYQDKEVSQTVPSPTLAWESAVVNYAFYLVDTYGNPVKNQTTGETGSFYEAVKVTKPVQYSEILLNNVDKLTSISVDTSAVPPGYRVYDRNAVYTITIESGGKISGWTIEKGDDKVQSSYVTDFRGAEASNAVNSDTLTDRETLDFTATTVWFALYWEPKCIDDAVVIDYGLPVDISVLGNDMFGEYGHLDGVGTDIPELNADGYVSGGEGAFGDSLTCRYGKATVNGSEVRYTPSTMAMNDIDEFVYEVKYTVDGSETNLQYYYGNVTVIPASIIYYEDTFTQNTVTSEDGTTTTRNGITFTGNGTKWVPEGEQVAGATQAEDRPGAYHLADYDANNVYGFDKTYETASKHSLGSAMKVNVSGTNTATAEFNFYGTGFDVISMTSGTTGTIIVTVKPVNSDGTLGDAVRKNIVDTFYGYVYDEETGWQPANDASDGNAIYQVPVMEVADLPYGHYNVVIKAAYDAIFDHSGDKNYNFYLDAIRIYDPAGVNAGETNTTVSDAYAADSEATPEFVELRNLILKAEDFNALEDGKQTEGAIFIDHSAGDYTIDDYKSYGPNNELYLAKGQSVAFDVDLTEYAGRIADIQIALKSANNKEVHIKASNGITENTRTIKTGTDLYYSIKSYLNMSGKTTMVLTNMNDDEAIVSITNIKVTFNAAQPAMDDDFAPFVVSRSTGGNALMMLRRNVEEVPETSEPEIDVPETGEPEESVPETDVPDESVPEVTDPETSEPEETEPEEMQPDEEAEKIQKEIEKALKKAAKEAEKIAKELQKAAEKAAKALSKLFGNWF